MFAMVTAPLRQPPIGFAHRGASAHAPENTLEAFELAVRLGATGLESDVWLTADGIPVLTHNGSVGRLRRRRISALSANDLPEHIPTLEEYYYAVDRTLPLSLDVKDEAAFDVVVATAINAGAEQSLWLCHPNWELVAKWRPHCDGVNLVDSTRIKKVTEGAELRAHRLAGAGIGTINMHHTDWSAGLVTMFHRFGVECFAWDLQQPAALAATLSMGVDGVYSDHVDRMVDALS